jgi:hypothetical protein
MKALALIIGNANYKQEKFILDNPVNDANSLSDKLMRLGFTVFKIKDCDIEKFEEEINYFGEELKKYDYGLFFFAGHGLQIDGLNYLTAIDTNFSSSISAKRTSILLDEVLGVMQKVNTKVNILIIDACRDNPLPNESRSVQSGLAVLNPPDGTIIAFSTSPGKKAMDSGGGNNSVYTKALSNHLDDSTISIEEFFKRVRATVSTMTEGNQTPWYHSSLIGDFSFNSGQLIHSVDLPYGDEFVADKNFISTGSKADNVIEGFKTHIWQNQNTAIRNLRAVQVNDIDKNRLFLIGRNILQASIGGEFECQKFMDNLSQTLTRYSINGENHLLNGILFEIYFNPEGKFREMNFKNGYIDEIFRLQTNLDFKSSFDFINKHLQPFREYLFYIPSSLPTSLPIEIVFEKFESDIFSETNDVYRIKSIKYKNLSILDSYELHIYGFYQPYADFIKVLREQLSVPINLLRISSNIELATKIGVLIFLPPNLKFSKRQNEI